MNYWSDLFTPETFEGFGRSDRTISGFRRNTPGHSDYFWPSPRTSGVERNPDHKPLVSGTGAPGFWHRVVKR